RPLRLVLEQEPPGPGHAVAHGHVRALVLGSLQVGNGHFHAAAQHLRGFSERLLETLLEQSGARRHCRSAEVCRSIRKWTSRSYTFWKVGPPCRVRNFTRSAMDRGRNSI